MKGEGFFQLIKGKVERHTTLGNSKLFYLIKDFISNPGKK